MTDKELLDLAAKAAGYKIDIWVSELNEANGAFFLEDGTIWNPLTDDGDALRLAVSIGMEVTIKKDRTEAMVVGDSYYEHVVHNGDKNLATRKAIVLCAANYAETKP